MSTTGNGQESLGDDFFEQILSVPTGYTDPSAAASNSADDIPMFLQLGSGGPSPGAGGGGGGATSAADIRSLAMGISMGMMPLGLNLEHSFLRQHEDHNSNHNNNNTNASSSPPNNSSATSGINERDSVHMPSLFPAFGQLQSQSARPPLPRPPQVQQFQSQPAAAPQPPAVRPRVRARRGQATDPHSIAERLRRERIADRMRALQELVPSCNKTDRAAMLDEIVDYVKFLRLQVKVLSMSRLGAAGAVAQLVADVPLSSALEGESIDGGSTQPEWEKWSNDGTEQQVAKLMEEDIGAAMQFLQSKALCIMPISLASAIYRTRQPDAPAFVKPESSTPS